jgi:solute carrier family 26 protein
VPNGFPIPEIPTTSFWPDLLADAFIIALIAFSINISMACLFARKHKYDIDSTQELYAYGISNIFSSFFHCFPSAASLSRSSVLEGAGGKTMLSAIFNALILLMVILFIGPLFESLPKACLASIIVVAFKNLLFQVKDFVTLWRINRFESITWLITFLSVVFLNVDYGLIIGVAVSNLMLVFKDQFFQIRSLGTYNDADDFVDKSFIIDIKPDSLLEDTNVKVFKIQRSIHFANYDHFQKSLFKLYGLSPLDSSRTKKFDVKFLEMDAEKGEALNEPAVISFSTVVAKREPDIILDMSAVNYADTNGVKSIVQMVEDFKKIDVIVYLCKSQDSLIEIMYHMDVLKKLDNNIYVSIRDALAAISNRNLTRNPKFEEEIRV